MTAFAWQGQPSMRGDEIPSQTKKYHTEKSLSEKTTIIKAKSIGKFYPQSKSEERI